MNGCLMSDQLTEKELEELNLLIENESKITEFALGRTKDKTLKGMYLNLYESGYLRVANYAGDEFFVHSLDPSAYWVVEKARLEKEEEAKRLQEQEARRKEDRKHDRVNMILGWVGGVISALVVSLITGFALLNGIPMG